MGVFDSILGGDKEKKERDEMRENIRRIREKVQNQGQAPPEEEPRGRGRMRRPPQEPQELPPAPEPPMEGREPAPPQREPEPRQAPQDLPQPPARQEPRQPPAQPPRQDSQEERKSLPEPPEVRELNIPDIEAGPLFITVTKFRQALQTVAELEQVARDLEDHIGAMENTLAEDREMNEAMRQKLDDAEDHTDIVKDIVSP